MFYGQMGFALFESYYQHYFNLPVATRTWERVDSSLAAIGNENLIHNFAGGFARLFVTSPEPDVIILDEASSALDVETEKKILENMYHRYAGKTIISIAHRLHTLKNADRILVFDEGTIAEQGRHEVLLAQKGIYYDFMKTYVDY
ncbi:MAG: hypothetical protein ICV83_00615 [Cytophagales bacterium]|nr:hypothetical protein [Cytophagales bacterium]